VVWALPWPIVLCHVIDRTNVEALKAHQGGLRENPHLTAVKEYGLYHRLIELCCNARSNILCTQDLAYMCPRGLSFPQLVVDCLHIIVVLQEQAAKVFENFNLFQHIPLDRELMLEGQRRCHCHLPLLSSLGPLLSLLRVRMVGVLRVHLHPASPAPWEFPLFWDLD
jgi:hypothetical protein